MNIWSLFEEYGPHTPEIGDEFCIDNITYKVINVSGCNGNYNDPIMETNINNYIEIPNSYRKNEFNNNTVGMVVEFVIQQ